MSAPSPVPGYYQDPSIPGYVRYWNGFAWVPGTSRPEPKPGEVLTPPPGAQSGAGTGAGPVVAPQAAPRLPDVEESGPMFLDEDPQAPVAESPATQERAASALKAQPPGARASAAQPPEAEVPGARASAAQVPGARAQAQASAARVSGAQAQGPGAQASAAQVPGAQVPRPDASANAGWNADPARQGGVGDDARRISWGHPGDAPAAPGPAAPGDGGGYAYPRQAPPAAGYAYPPGAPAAQAAQSDPVPWPQQVQQLAGVPGGPDQAIPWRPDVVGNPFLQAQEARPAPLGRRFAARLIDSLLIGTVVSSAAFPLVTASVQHLENKINAAKQSGENVQVWLIDGTTGLYLAILVAVLLIVGLLYEALPTAKWGRTLGKKLLKLQVLDIESQLPPRFGRAFRRMLVRQLLDVVVVGGVNAVWCVVDRPWRQCWHDKAARTFVAGEN